MRWTRRRILRGRGLRDEGCAGVGRRVKAAALPPVGIGGVRMME